MLTLIIPREEAAALVYEMNRMYSKHVMKEQTPIPWEYAEMVDRQSIATAIDLILKGVSLHEAHESWRAEKVSQGWTYGPVKDFKAKTSPYLKPWQDLTIIERGKDLLMQGIIISLITVDSPQALQSR